MMRIAEFAERIGKSVSTLRLWDKNGTLPAKRTATGQRYYTDGDYYRALRINLPETAKKTVLYSRVSSHSQKPDLANQKLALESFAAGRGLEVTDHYSEVGSGMNFHRPKFLQLMDEVEKGEVATIVIAHRDRLVRFGFEYFEERVKAHGGQILVLNAESLSPEEELTQDLLTILHVFSSRMYGLRRYAAKIKRDLQSNAGSTEGQSAAEGGEL
jgi:putative resolvase